MKLKKYIDIFLIFQIDMFQAFPKDRLLYVIPFLLFIYIQTHAGFITDFAYRNPKSSFITNKKIYPTKFVFYLIILFWNISHLSLIFTFFILSLINTWLILEMFSSSLFSIFSFSLSTRRPPFCSKFCSL